MIRVHEQSIKDIRAVNNNCQYTMQLDHLLGQGSYGKVYKGYDKKNPGRKLAIKAIELNPAPPRLKQSIEKIQREVTLIFNLQKHPNLLIPEPIKIYSESNFYILMQRCNGGSLHKELPTKRYTEQEIYFVFMQMVNGYKVLYQNKILHLDIAPRNVLIHNGRYLFSDFGLAALHDSEQANNRQINNISYRCPQSFLDKNYKGCDKTDVYAMGMVMYFLIYKQHPILSKQRSTHEQKMYLIGTREASKPSQVSGFSIDNFRKFREILAGMLKKNPRERLSFRELLGQVHTFSNITSFHETKVFSMESLVGDEVKKFSSQVLVVGADITRTRQFQIQNESKNKNLKSQIQEIRSQGRELQVVQRLSSWISSRRKIVVFANQINHRLQMQSLSDEQKGDECKSCILNGISLICKQIDMMVEQFSMNRVFSPAQWGILWESGESDLMRRINIDQGQFSRQKEQIFASKQYQVPEFYADRAQLRNHLATEEKFIQLYNKALRSFYRLRIQESKNMVTSLMVLMMIKITSAGNWDQALEDSGLLDRFQMQIKITTFQQNVERISRLVQEVGEEVFGIDFSSQLKEQSRYDVQSVMPLLM